MMGSTAPLGIKDFEDNLRSVEKASFADEESRARAAVAARSLFYRLETPQESFYRRGWMEA